MASPVVQEAIESSTSTASTSHIVTLPTATAGQLLLIILDIGSTAATINAHSELTELLDEGLANGLYIAYRQMNGSEPASYTLTSSASTRSAQIAYRISGAENPATQAPQIATTGSGTSATPDPPTSATPASSKDYLFIAFYGAAGEEADDDTWSDTPPTNYTPSPPRQKACGVAGTNLGGMIAAAERQLTTGVAENPGTFAKDASAAWRSQTIMVHPTSGTIHEATSSVSGTATMAGAAVMEFAGAASISGTATVIANALVNTTHEAAASISGTATVLAVGSVPVYVYSDYERYLQLDLTKYGTVTVTLEGILKTSGPDDARLRLYDITSDAPVTGGQLQTASMSFTRLRTVALGVSGTKEYKVQAGVVSGSTTTIKSASLVVGT